MVSTIALIVLLAIPTLPIAVAGEADAESTSSLELVETQTVNYGAASTLSPTEPFTMIITNDPQFPWPNNNVENALREQWHKVSAIAHIWDNTQGEEPEEPEDYGRWVERWPSPTNTDVGNNNYFDSSMWNKIVASPLMGVIINGDLAHSRNSDINDNWGMTGKMATGSRADATNSRNWFYRDYYVSYLRNRCPGLNVYSGFGNHDNKWTMYDLANALVLDSEDDLRKWINFPTSLVNVDFNEAAKRGSLSYSWDVGNYHFVQINDGLYDNESDPNRLDLSTTWLNGMQLTDPLDGWLEDDLDEAGNKKIIINYHGSEKGWPYDQKTRLLEFLRNTENNVVAMFQGHMTSGFGLLEWVNNTKNSFGQNIPIFHGGHADDGSSRYETILLAEFADDYMNVGVVMCGYDDDGGGVPQWREELPENPNFMRTLKWVDTTPPSVSLQAKGSPMEGVSSNVASVELSDDRCYRDTWTCEIDFGDGTPAQKKGPYGPNYGLGASFDIEHKYVESGNYNVTVIARDSGGHEGIANCEVAVLNADPVVRDVEFVDENLIHENFFKGIQVHLMANFSDTGILDNHNATIKWGDGNLREIGVVNEQDGVGTVTSTHIYNAPGSYTVNVTVTDDDGGIGTRTATADIIVALNGFVIDEYNNSPLAGVTINCNAETTTTDASGYYEFTPLVPGDYLVEMTKIGHASTAPSKNATIIAGQETQVNFTTYPLPDIVVAKSTVDTERFAGDTITYQITVENQGDGPATNMVVSDLIPNMTTFVSSNASANIQGQNVTWLIGPLANQSSTTIELTARTSLLLYPDTILNNSVTVDFDDWKGLPQISETASATTTNISTVPTENLQGIGYWRHQVKAFLDGKSCDYTENEWYLLFDKIRTSSQIYDFDYTLEDVSDIILAKATGKDTMETQAKQQLFAFWLNLAARAVAADTAVELADLTTATTIAEALTHCEDILLDPAHTITTCECSKDICDRINNCEGLPW